MARALADHGPEILVEADTFEVSAEAVVLGARLAGGLALCLHDEARGIGGLLHLRLTDADGRVTDVTDNTLSGILVVLDRFKKAVLGNAAPGVEAHARIIAHAPPPVTADEPSASLVDLIRADLADLKMTCGAQVSRRLEPVQVCFQPCDGRLWIRGPGRR
jgi:hypothetical protein